MKMSTRILTQEDPELEPYKEAISKYTDVYEMLGMPYWVFVDDSPFGLVAVGKEPVQLFAPLGTPLSMIRILDFEHPTETLKNFSQKALAISEENEVEYASISIPSKYEEVIDLFKVLGFQVLADTQWMVRQLDGAFEPSGALSFEKVQRGEAGRFLELTREFMSGSPDSVLNIVLENLLDVPEEFRGLWYDRERLYYAREDGETVGILDLNLNEGAISNIGVAPRHRGKGYGRQIMLFALRTLKEEGLEKAGLRVHVDNKPAIHLYENLGFGVKEQNSTLIWRK